MPRLRRNGNEPFDRAVRRGVSQVHPGKATKFTP